VTDFRVGEQVVITTEGRKLGKIMELGLFDNDGKPAAIVTPGVLRPLSSLDHLTEPKKENP
jgi:hypothetical protein